MKPARGRSTPAGAAAATLTRQSTSAAARTPRGGPKNSYAIHSLVLGLSVLEALVRSGREKGVTELAAELGTTKWRIFRQLHTLCEEGYVVQDERTEKFTIGRRVYSLIEALPSRHGFVSEARAELGALRDERGHTAVLASPLDDRGTVIVDVLAGTRAVQFTLKVGAVFDLHASAHGKAALAFGPPNLLQRVIARRLVRLTDATITDPERLRREVERIRSRGWAVAPEESFRGVNALVAPIFSGAGKLQGTIGVFGSIDHIPRSPDPKDVDAVVRAARRVSARLGWTAQ